MIWQSNSYDGRRAATRRMHLDAAEAFPGNRTIRGFYVPWWAWGMLFPAASLALHFAGAF